MWRYESFMWLMSLKWEVNVLKKKKKTESYIYNGREKLYIYKSM